MSSSETRTSKASDTDTSAGSGSDAARLGNLGSSFAQAFPELCVDFVPDQVPTPSKVALNSGLAADLGLDADWLATADGVAVLAGSVVPTHARPVAMGYAGHQFGNFSPRLGDGRAVLLGELSAHDGSLRDLHLKGTGRTTWARGGDGKATLGPMLREYLVAEAMAALSIPTTRSLAVCTTGETVMRDEPEPGAVLARVAASHIRVGTFEYAVRLGGEELVGRLARYCIERHHRAAADADNPYVALLRAVIEAQAELIARWMLVGFIHGVMNTDNMTISGEGIDYGPCAFMDRYDPATVYSSIDHGGRYAYGNQPAVAAWNLARLAETLLGLIDERSEVAIEIATEELKGFEARFKQHWNSGLAAKIGLTGPSEALTAELLELMRAGALDWTSTFRGLAADLRADSGGDPIGEQSIGVGSVISVDPTGLSQWRDRWVSELQQTGRDLAEVAEDMDRVNPIYVPRNHLVDEALRDATLGSLDAFEELRDVLADPFTQRAGRERFAEPAPADFDDRFRTFCGT